MRILLVTEVSDEVNIGGSSVRMGLTRWALEALGEVTVALVDGRYPEGPPQPTTRTMKLARLSTPKPWRLGPLRWGLGGLSEELDNSLFGSYEALANISSESYDLVWFFKTMSYLKFRPRMSGPAQVIDFDDLDENTRVWPSALKHQLDRRSMRALRRRLHSRVGAVSVCSHVDQLRLGLDPSFVLPNVAPRSPDECVTRPSTGGLLFVGSLGYRPNLRGITWFVDEVFPEIRRLMPTARLRIVGPGCDRLPPKLGPGIEVTGAVPDVNEHYAWAKATVVPLFEGSGTRIKVLEALSHGKPVVSTPLGVEGIQLEHGVNYLNAANSKDFAAQCLAVLQDDMLARRIGLRGRTLVQEQYSREIFADTVKLICDFALNRSIPQLAKRKLQGSSEAL